MLLVIKINPSSFRSVLTKNVIKWVHPQLYHLDISFSKLVLCCTSRDIYILYKSLQGVIVITVTMRYINLLSMKEFRLAAIPLFHCSKSRSFSLLRPLFFLYVPFFNLIEFNFNLFKFNSTHYKYIIEIRNQYVVVL